MKRNENRILVDKGTLFVWTIVLALTLAFNVLLVVVFSKGTTDPGKVVVWASLHALSVSFFVATSLATNRSCNFVYLHDGVLDRRGYLFGFKKTISISAIKEIKKVTLMRDGTYFVLVDGVSNYEDRSRRNSAIFIPCNDEGVKFIRQFFSGPLPSIYY